jgi:hypothetical protein
MFLRFTIADLHEVSGQPLGIFHAVRYLRDEGQLTTQQEDVANEVFDWLSDHLDAPTRMFLKTTPMP